MQQKKVQLIAKSYYARKDIQKAIYDFCQNRETIPRYLEGFGKRPDALDYPFDIFNFAKKGATSFHCSEELWSNPLQISKDMTQEQVDELRIGWDFLIDIDSKYLDYSKIAAKLIIKALEYHGIKNIGIKFSGSKGFHLIIPWKAFPKEIDGKQTKDMFPEWARLIAKYIQEEMIHDKLTKKILEQTNIQTLPQPEKLSEPICTKCRNLAVKQNSVKYICPACGTQMQNTKIQGGILRCPSCQVDMKKVEEEQIFICNHCNTNSLKNPGQFIEKKTVKALIDSVDIILVAPRHLFRVPYSLHEKTALSSIVIDKNEIENFQPSDADPLKVKIKSFMPDSEEDEARELLLQALDWQKKKQKTQKKFTGKSIDVKNLTINESMFPPCIQKLMKGMKQDGRKRALFILLSFFNSLEFPQEYIKEKISAWNKKNYKPLLEGYIQSQINWSERNKIMPPNCDKSYYRELGAQCSCQGVKNPINYTIKEAMKAGRRSKKNKIKNR